MLFSIVIAGRLTRLSVLFVELGCLSWLNQISMFKSDKLDLAVEYVARMFGIVLSLVLGVWMLAIIFFVFAVALALPFLLLFLGT